MPAKTDLGIGIVSAIVASGMVTPIILTIDKAVVQAAAGQSKLFPALKQGTINFLKAPHKVFITVPCLLVWGVYGVTYMAANTIDVYNERQQIAS